MMDGIGVFPKYLRQIYDTDFWLGNQTKNFWEISCQTKIRTVKKDIQKWNVSHIACVLVATLD